MTNSVAGVMQHATRHIDPTLITAASWSRVLEIGEWIPAAAVHSIVLEVRLGGGNDQVDLSTRLSPEGGTIVAGLNPLVALPDECFAEAAWKRVRTLCERWAEPASSTSGYIDHLWLEFDAPSSGRVATDVACPPTPSCFIALDAAAQLRRGDDFAAMAADVLHPLLGGDLVPTTRRGLQCAADRLPPDVGIQYLALMLARGEAAVRLYPGWLPCRAWPGYLEALGWEGSTALLTDLLADLTSRRANGARSAIGLGHIDIVHGGVLPRIGLEYTFDRTSQDHGTLAEREFLEQLVARGLCEPAKRDALLRWPGSERVLLPDLDGKTLLARRVNNVKLVIDDHGVREAKAYQTITARRARAAGARGTSGRSTF